MIIRGYPGNFLGEFSNRGLGMYKLPEFGISIMYTRNRNKAIVTKGEDESRRVLRRVMGDLVSQGDDSCFIPIPLDFVGGI